MNSCNFIGRMGANPKYFPGDANKKSVLNFSLAIKKDYQPKQGEPDCYWFNFKAFGARADVIEKYVEKGVLIGVTCKANIETFQDQSGNNRTITNFIVDNITFCEKKNNGTSNNGASYTNNFNPNNGFSGNPPNIPAYDDEDLPF